MIGRTNTGGGGSLRDTDAMLRVQAPAGSTVTITKGTVTKTDLGHENADDHTVYDYYFIIHQSQFDSVNPWTVTATLNGQISSDTVIIDAADEYDVVLNYLLPSGYIPVEYIESTGTQYINTGLNVTAGSKISLLGQMSVLQNDNTFFEATTGANNRIVLAGLSTGAIRYIHGSTNLNSSAQNIDTDLDMNISTSFVLNGQTIGSCSVTAQSRPLYLFAGNDIGTTARYGKVRIKYFKILDSSNVVQREMYPCYRLSDSVAGLYDIKNNVFYTNAGSGTFVVGGSV